MKNVHKKRRGKTYLGVVMALILTMGLSACGEGGSDLSAGELEAIDNTTITLHGLEDKDIEISVAQLKELDSETEKAEATRSNGDTVSVKATGPLLDTLLEEYGVDKSDFNTIRFYAADGYSIAMPSSFVEENDIIIAYYDKGKPFSEEDGPVRVIVPGQRAMYWVRMLTRIDFETEASAMAASELVFLDTALPQLQTETITRQGVSMTAVKNRDLIAAYADADDNTVYNVYLKASDGLSKNETKANFIKSYLRVEGEGAPEFTGPELPDGMTVNGMVSVNYKDTAFLSLAQYLRSESAANVQDGKIPFSDVIKFIGSMTSDTYRFIGLDGTEAEYSFDDLSGAYLQLDSSGNAVFHPGTEAGSPIEKILRIEAVS